MYVGRYKFCMSWEDRGVENTMPDLSVFDIFNKDQQRFLINLIFLNRGLQAAY